MCGLYGWIGSVPPDAPGYIERIAAKMIHRGPDDEGSLIQEKFTLGFRRLSILDLSPKGHQPMTTADGKSHIIFNGEVYNYKELAHEFRQSLGELKSASDSEILLNLLHQQGTNILQKLNGMFAFAFVNEKSGEYLIVRDRLGVKPLYYTVADNRLFFASELPSLLEFPVSTKINRTALNQYLRLGFIPPPYTIYDGIFKLEPGALLKGNLTDPTQFKKQKWWDLPLQIDDTKERNHWLAETDELLFDATGIRLRSDVPTGIFLSGGVDSTLVAHYASIQTAYTKPVAFTVTFEEESYNEYNIAAEVARAKKLELVPVKVTELGLQQSHRIIDQCGEPFADSSFINQLFISEQARKHATVFLTGDGGDEAFAGYTEYVNMFHNQRKYKYAAAVLGKLYSATNAIMPYDSALIQKFSKFSAGADRMGALVRNNFRDPAVSDLLSPEWLAPREAVEEPLWNCWNKSNGLPIVRRMQLFDYAMYLEPDVLVKVDRATMANSIEARSPFLDYRMVEMALKIPVEYNVDNSKGKSLLRTLAKKHLPPAVFEAPKKGFGLPVRVWMDNDFKNKLWTKIENSEHAIIWNKEKLRALIFNNSTSRNLYALVWRIWMFHLWAEQNKQSFTV